jgi:hypothetical protein
LINYLLQVNRILIANKSSNSSFARVESAAGSAIKGIRFLSPISKAALPVPFVVSVGYDQRLSLWKIDKSRDNPISWVDGTIVNVSDVCSIDIAEDLDTRINKFWCVVVGEGCQIITVKP